MLNDCSTGRVIKSYFQCACGNDKAGLEIDTAIL